jgi:hypothetical protein
VARPGDGWGIRVFTDTPECFDDLGVGVTGLGADLVESWLGGTGYLWRAKIHVVAHAFSDPDITKVVLVDGDTWFRSSPSVLFGRLGPGRTVMHVNEGLPSQAETAAVSHVLARHQPVDSKGTAWDMGAGRESWNSGVVGLAREDVGLCTEVLELADQLLSHGFGSHTHTAEQVAFATCLSQRTVVRPAAHVVVHYWPSQLRDPFDARLAEARGRRDVVEAADLEDLWQHRPRETTMGRAKRVVRQVLGRLGVRI